MVSAWARTYGAGIVLAQEKVAAKSNEITAIPRLLYVLDLPGCSVTIDAMGCQRAIAEQIVGAQSDYVLALKGDHGTSAADTQRLLDEAFACGWAGVAHGKTATLDTGMWIEQRRYWLITDALYVAYLNAMEKWVGLAGLGLVDAERQGQRARSLLKNERMAKGGVQNKRLQAGWSDGYLLTALAGLL